MNKESDNRGKPVGPKPSELSLKPQLEPGQEPSSAPEDRGKGWNLNSSDISADSQDPLIGCLVALTKLFGSPRSSESMVSGLPLEDNRLTPSLFLRAADRIGLSARIVRRGIKDIPKIVLPVVLLLKNKSACVLLKKVSAKKFEVLLPESGFGTKTLDLDELMEMYDGYAIFVRPAFQFHRHGQTARKETAGSWFWGTLRKFSGTYSQVIIAAFLINSFAVASPLFVMNVYDRVVPNRAIETLWVLAIGITTVIGFDFLLKSLRGYFVDNAGRRADVLLSSRIFEHVLNIKMSSHPNSAGAFANRLRDFESLREFFTSATLVALVDLPFLFIFLAIIWMIGGWVVIVPLLAVPIVIFGGLLIQYPLRSAVQKSQEESAQKHGVIVETIGALETVKSLGAEGRMQRDWERFVGAAAKTGLTARYVS
ncbi:MAG: ABC transporter transmembrane domain-containing protein, partial [Rhodospirillales bacterium]|nr:ABC transporter transmembrane domain-containing protein [Rhodospirillales bacterium]